MTLREQLRTSELAHALAEEHVTRLQEQLEASQRHHEAAVVKIHLVEGRADRAEHLLRQIQSSAFWNEHAEQHFAALRESNSASDP